MISSAAPNTPRRVKVRVWSRASPLISHGICLLPAHPHPRILESQGLPLSPGHSHRSSPQLLPPSLRPTAAGEGGSFKRSPRSGRGMPAATCTWRPAPRPGPAPLRPLPLASIPATQRPGQPEPRAPTGEAGSQLGRAEPGFLKGSLASCCSTARRRGARLTPRGLASEHTGQAVFPRCIAACNTAAPGLRRSLSPNSPWGDPSPSQTRPSTLGLHLPIHKTGVRLESSFVHSFIPQTFLGPYSGPGDGRSGRGPSTF